jgi:hypothetical protein
MQSTILKAKDGTLILDKPALKWLGSQKAFMAVIEGDSLIIKRKRSLLDFAKLPGKDALSLEQISREVHKSRHSK